MLTAVVIGFGVDVRSVGDMGQLPDSLPQFLIPDVPLSWETLRILLPVSATLAVVGLLESMMTLQIVEDITETPSERNRECRPGGQHGHRVPRWHGGCAMIGQSVINVTSGGRGRLSCLVAGVLLLVLVVYGSDPGAADPDGCAGGGDDHGQHRHFQQRCCATCARIRAARRQ